MTMTAWLARVPRRTAKRPLILMTLAAALLFGFHRAFALRVLEQKLEIAACYAARRWQLESHRNGEFVDFDEKALKAHIERLVRQDLGIPGAGLSVTRGNESDAVILTAWGNTIYAPLSRTFNFMAVKHVPHRDRPIAYRQGLSK